MNEQLIENEMNDAFERIINEYLDSNDVRMKDFFDSEDYENLAEAFGNATRTIEKIYLEMIRREN